MASNYSGAAMHAIDAARRVLRTWAEEIDDSIPPTEDMAEAMQALGESLEDFDEAEELRCASGARRS